MGISVYLHHRDVTHHEITITRSIYVTIRHIEGVDFHLSDSVLSSISFSKIIVGDYGRYQGDNRLHKLIRRLVSDDERDSRSSAVKSLREYLYQSDNRVSNCTLPNVNECS